MTPTPLPAGWSHERIGDIAVVSRGASPRPIASPRWFSDRSDVGWVRIADLGRSDGLTLESTTQRLSPDGVARSRLLPPGTLIMSIAATVGVPIVTAIPACIHDGFVALERLAGVDQTYLLYVLKSLQGQLRGMGQTGSQANINTEIVNDLEIPLPPASEQRRIGAALSDCDRHIAATRRLIEKKSAMGEGLQQQLLTGRTRLPGFTARWSRRPLADLGVFLKGRGIKRDDLQGSGVPCIRYGEIYSLYRRYIAAADSFVSRKVAQTALPLKKGDLLFAASGETRAEIGKCIAFIGTEPTVAGGDIIVMRGQSANAVYLSLVANTPAIQAEKARVGQGDAVVHIGSRALGGIEIDLPPREEQDAIADFIIDAGREVDVLEAQLGKAEAIKRGMMQELLSGNSRLSERAAA